MAVTRRRGQFFVIGALLIVTMLAGITLFDVGGVFTPDTDTPKHLFDQSVNEFPAMLNTVTAEDGSVHHMERRVASYLAFQNHMFTTHGLQSAAHALVVVPAPHSDNVTLVFANSRGDALEDVAVTVDSETQTRAQLPDQHTSTFTFDSVPQQFDVRLAFSGADTFNHSYTTTRHRRSALYQLRVDGESQRWQSTRIY